MKVVLLTIFFFFVNKDGYVTFEPDSGLLFANWSLNNHNRLAIVDENDFRHINDRLV